MPRASKKEATKASNVMRKNTANKTEMSLAGSVLENRKPDKAPPKKKR